MRWNRMLFILAGAIIVTGVVAMLPMAWMGGSALKASYREYAERDARANTRLLAATVEQMMVSGSKEGLGDLIQKARTASITRYTIVDADGAVLYESDEKKERMDRHQNRPEIVEALSGREGLDIRKSSTLGTEWIYVAVPIEANGKTIAVRGAISLEDLNVRLGSWWRMVVIGCTLALAVLLVLAFVVARVIGRPIERMAVVSRKFAKGDLSHRLIPAGSGEMRELADSLNAMAAELGEKFRLVNRQQAEMRAVLSSMDEGVLAVDGKGIIVFINAAAGYMLNLDDGAVGRVVEEVVRQPEFLALLREAAVSGERVERGVRLVIRDADLLIQASAGLLVEDGREAGIMVVFRDVTHVKQLEVVRRDFIANVSHELRTPITAIQGCLEVLISEGAIDKDEEKSFLEMAYRNSCRISNIITDLLMLSSMESGNEGKSADLSQSRVADVLAEAASICEAAAKLRQVEIRLSCPEDLTAMMNARLMRHAVANLIDNAIKYGPEKGLVDVLAEKRGEATEIRVIDKGRGISPKHRERIFERFYRISGSGTHPDGAGLGLSIVKHIVQVHGGTISVESETGKGSSFIITLPDLPA